MPVEIQQPGIAELYGQAATLAGKSQAAIRKEQAAIRAGEIRQEQKLREEAQIRAIEASEMEQRRALQARGLQQEQAIEAQRIREESAQIQLFQQIRAREEAQREAERARKEDLEIQQQYQTNMKLLDAQLDLETFERAKRWEIDKMEISSRVDFEEEEADRRRIKSDAKNATRSLEKEIEAGRVSATDPQVKRYLEYYKIKEQFPGERPPMSLITPTAPRVEKPIFTPYNIQQGLGELTTGAPSSALGLPMEVLTEKADHIAYATNRWGPNWQDEVPEAARIIENKFPDEAPHFIALNQPLTVEIVDSYLIAAGNDINKAMQMAQRDGYDVDIKPISQPMVEPVRPFRGRGTTGRW